MTHLEALKGWLVGGIRFFSLGRSGSGRRIEFHRSVQIVRSYTLDSPGTAKRLQSPLCRQRDCLERISVLEVGGRRPDLVLELHMANCLGGILQVLDVCGGRLPALAGLVD